MNDSDNKNDDNSSETIAKLQTDISTLKTEMDTLKSDNKRLRTLRAVSEGIIFQKFV